MYFVRNHSLVNSAVANNPMLSLHWIYTRFTALENSLKYGLRSRLSKNTEIFNFNRIEFTPSGSRFFPLKVDPFPEGTHGNNTVHVLKFCTPRFLTKWLWKQCRPRSDCSWRSSVIRVSTVCHSTKYLKKQLHKNKIFAKKVWNE